MSNKILHKKSHLIVEGNVKTPTPSQLDYGEIAVNYSNSGETLFIKNDSNNIASFSSNKVFSQILNNNVEAANNSVNSLSGNVVNKLSEYATSANTHSAIESAKENIPTASSIEQSGFTKDAITDVVINGVSGQVSSNTAVVTLPINELPVVTSSDNNKILQVINGSWALVTPINVYMTYDTPNNQYGNDGDICVLLDA